VLALGIGEHRGDDERGGERASRHSDADSRARRTFLRC
jgi:hypothetical protein